ncbi:MAG: rod shape-determining protein MreD [Coriobacteriaceae bacterium]|nr:rod shape-determining protein MreD [Coriobacteriaceae bacterium]
MAFEMNSNRRTRSGFVITVIACMLLHLMLAPQFSVMGGRFNFMLVLTAVCAISGDSRSMVYVGFFSGLFYDLTTASPIGLMPLLLALTGYTIALMSRGLASDLGMQTIRVVILAVFAVNIICSVALFFMGVESNLLTAVGVHGLASGVLDVLACVPLLLMGGSGNSGSGFSSRGRGRAHGGLSYGGSRYKVLR